MPIPPQVPTSFVPRAPMHPSSGPKHYKLDLIGALYFVALGIFILAILASAGVWGWQYYLNGQLSAKQTKLQGIEQGLKTSSVQDLISLQNRLSAGSTLLDAHTTFSRFFNTLESSTVQGVSFSSMEMKLNKDGKTAAISASGIATNFNMLAAESISLAKQKGVSDIAFSDFGIDKKSGKLKFSLAATAGASIVQNFSAVVSATSSSATTTNPFSQTNVNSSATTTKP